MPRPLDPQAHGRILDAAEALLAEHGPAFTIGEVARRAGVSRGSVYRRFASHADLLEQLVSERGVEREQIARNTTRDRILDAVSELLRSRDFAALTIEEIADRAGVGVATVYRQFGDRDGVIAEFARDRSPRRLAATLDASAGDDLERDLLELAASALQFLVDYPHLVRMAFLSNAERERLPAPIRGRPASAQLALVRYLERQVAAGRVSGDPRTLSRLFIGMIAATAADDSPRGPGWVEDAAAVIVGVLLTGCLSETRTK